MSTLKITIARPVIHVKRPNRPTKLDLHARNLKIAPPMISLQVKDERLPTHRARFAALGLSLYADANLQQKLCMFKLFITLKLWLPFVTCISINVSTILPLLHRWTQYPLLCMTLSSFFTVTLALMRQLANLLVGFLFELETCLAEKFLAFLLFIESSIDTTLTSPERQIESSPTTSFKVPTTKLGSVRENHLHEFDTEGWLLVANPGTNHLEHKL
ncbi:hypothetical protein BJ912DRAFT_1001512 [Pholiota molesta]|nr:hypothetical protein BJ912DRAFT_1001512 [Pholiota molesta]